MFKPVFTSLLFFALTAALTANELVRIGPASPPIRGVKKASAAPVWVAYGSRAMLRLLPGATVVVEDSLPEMPTSPRTNLQPTLGSVFIRLNKSELKAMPGAFFYLPDGANPMVVMLGGNVVQRMY